MEQRIFYNFTSLKDILKMINAEKIFLVCGKKSCNDELINLIKTLIVDFEIFQDLTSNPKFEEAENARLCFSKGDFQAILAIGGGSVIDVSKYLTQFTTVPLIAVPTTAGSGSESTSFVVLYKSGKKISLQRRLPNFVILEPNFLESLPLYQRKCTLLDAFCQAIEAFWSINSSKQSKQFSIQAINLILDNYKDYFNFNKNANKDILVASNKAGKAINLAKTTAAHAMSYEITSRLGFPHGHAVAICMSEVWNFLENNFAKCVDPRGEDFLRKTMKELSQIISLKQFSEILKEIEIQSPKKVSKNLFETFVDSVNLERLKNFPVQITKMDLMKIYEKVFSNI